MNAYNHNTLRSDIYDNYSGLKCSTFGIKLHAFITTRELTSNCLALVKFFKTEIQ